MKKIPSEFNVNDYCKAIKSKDIIINREYQRSAKVWPPPARSFLIETIFLDFPIPKLSLYQVTDVKSKKTFKEIIDGQQRSQAIFDFYDNKLKISPSSEIKEVAGKTYSQLDEEYQQKFLDYSLSVDIFVATNPSEIREIFRRINSYTVPLNPEEKRHAQFQGQIKWFIYHLSKKYDQVLVDLGVFRESQLARMADAKLFSEVCHAFLYGISTTSAKNLDKLYEIKDKNFQEKDQLESRIDYSIDFILKLEDIHNGALMKSYNFYALVLAIFHMRNEVDCLHEIYQSSSSSQFEIDKVTTNLTNLADSLEDTEATNKFPEFVDANLSKTNVAEQRKTRFIWFCKSLEPDLL